MCYEKILIKWSCWFFYEECSHRLQRDTLLKWQTELTKIKSNCAASRTELLKGSNPRFPARALKGFSAVTSALQRMTSNKTPDLFLLLKLDVAPRWKLTWKCVLCSSSFSLVYVTQLQIKHPWPELIGLLWNISNGKTLIIQKKKT